MKRSRRQQNWNPGVSNTLIHLAGFGAWVQRLVRGRRFSAIWWFLYDALVPTWFLTVIFILWPIVCLFFGYESGENPSCRNWSLRNLRLRPPRDARPMPRMRNNSAEIGNNFKLT